MARRARAGPERENGSSWRANQSAWRKLEVGIDEDQLPVRGHPCGVAGS
jgi:hypothetical protein